jgi:voltage-gated potassium channel
MTLNPEKALVDLSPYQLFMLALCIFALSLLAAETLLPLTESTSTILQYADNFVCVLFLADFINHLLRAPNRLRYFATWGWIDLLSSIPAVDALRIGRAARVFRILRVLRGMKSARALAQFVMLRRAESAGLSAVLVSLLLVVFSSIAVLQFEMPAGGNIQSAEDAMWWAISTMTTVGYGDRYPTTSEGRLIAIFLMAAGVGVFGMLSGLVAAWFLSPAEEEADEDREQIKLLIGELRAQLASHAASHPHDSGRAGNVRVADAQS